MPSIARLEGQTHRVLQESFNSLNAMDYKIWREKGCFKMNEAK